MYGVIPRQKLTHPSAEGKDHFSTELFLLPSSTRTTKCSMFQRSTFSFVLRQRKKDPGADLKARKTIPFVAKFPSLISATFSDYFAAGSRDIPDGRCECGRCAWNSNMASLILSTCHRPPLRARRATGERDAKGRFKRAESRTHLKDEKSTSKHIKATAYSPAQWPDVPWDGGGIILRMESSSGPGSSVEKGKRKETTESFLIKCFENIVFNGKFFDVLQQEM